MEGSNRIVVELLQREQSMLESTPAGRRLREVDALLAANSSRHEPSYALVGLSAAARMWLNEVGSPQSTGQIKKVLLERGLRTTSAKFTANVYSTLSNSKNFVRIGLGRAGRWALAGWNLPEREQAA